MKKLLFVFIAVMMIFTIFSSNALARSRTMDLKLGIFNPDDAKTGFIIGGRLGSNIDNRINVGLALDYFHKGYDISTKKEDVEVVEARFSSNMLPIMVDIQTIFPLDYNAELTPFAHLGLGYEILWNSEEYPDQEDETRTYTGFGWLLGGGVLYKIGHNSDLILEIFYNSCTVKRDEGKSEIGWLIREMDVSGLGARVGLQLQSF